MAIHEGGVVSRRVFMAGVAMAGAAGLAACSSGATPGGAASSGSAPKGSSAKSQASNPGAGGPITLTMWTFLNPDGGTDGRSKALKTMIQDFETSHKGVTIQTVTRQWSTLTSTYLAAVAAGNQPDIVWIQTGDYWRVVGGGALADIAAANSASATPATGEIISSTTSDKGKLYGIPTSFGAFGIMYRNDYLKAAGLATADLATWDGFSKAVPALTKAGHAGFGQAFSLTSPDIQAVEPHLLQMQGTLFNSDGSPKWANPDGVKAMEYSIGFVNSGGTPKAALTSTNEDLYNQLAAGNVSIISATSTRIPTMLGQITDGKLGYSLWPRMKDSKEHNIVAGWHVAVSAQSKHVDAATEFVIALGNAKNDQLWVSVGGQSPMWPGTKTEDMPGGQFMPAVRHAFSTGWIPPANATKGDYRIYFIQAYQGVLAKSQSAMDALKAAEDSYKSAGQS